MKPLELTYTFAEFDVTVDRVLDGDTFIGHGEAVVVVPFLDLEMRLEFKKLRIRLLGVDAPERGKPGYAEANAEANRLLAPGTVVTLRNVQPKTDSFGRVLAEVIVPPDINYGEHMIKLGLATPA